MSPRTFTNVFKHTRRAPPRAAAAARLFLSASLALLYAACAAGARDPEVTRPRAEGPPYPIILAASDERRAASAANWLALAGIQQGTPPPQPELQPITSTVRALPPAAPDTLRLPLVELGGDTGADAKEATDEEATRESLRRFIASARDLLGVAPQDLSLVETQTEAGGARRVRYLQKPFPYPLRNNFGVVEIRFAPDRRVLSLASTAVPDTERIAGALAALRPSLIPAPDIPARLAGRSFGYPAPDAPQTFTPAPADSVDVRELVVFPVRRNGDNAAAALDIHLAWEAIVGRGGTNLLVHIDAVTGEVLSAAPTTETPRPAPTPTPMLTLTPTPTPQSSPAPARPEAAPDAPAPSATPPPAGAKSL